MKAVQITAFGDPAKATQVIDHDPGACAPDEIVVDVLASPINPSDVMILAGQYGQLPSLPAIGGNEGTGRVVEVGGEVDGFTPGDLVILPLGGGTWSQRLKAKAPHFTPLPAGADPIQMSMLMINPPTAHLMLKEFVTPTEGAYVVQNGANSGVGTWVIRLAKELGWKTINVVRRSDSRAAVEALGGDKVVVEAETDDLPKAIRKAADGAPVPLALDCVGGTGTMLLADAVDMGGTVVNYGGLSGHACKVSLAATIFKDVSLRGFWLVWWFQRATPEERQALFMQLAGKMMAGDVAVNVAATHTLDDFDAALAAAAAGGRDGKIVLTPNPDLL